MSAFKAVMKVVACTVLGAVFGVILFVFAGYPLLLAAAGGRDMNGGIAMGMVTGVAPLGLFIGGFAGFAIGLRWAVARPQDRRPFTARRKYTIAGVLAALVVGYFSLLFILQGPAGIKMSSEPDLEFEFRTAAALLAANPDFTPAAELYSEYQDRHIPLETELRIEGGEAILAGKLHVVKGRGYENFSLRALLTPEITVDGVFPLWPGAEVQPGYAEWDEVGYIHNPKTGEVELGYSQDVHFYRYRVMPHREQ